MEMGENGEIENGVHHFFALSAWDKFCAAKEKVLFERLLFVP